MSLYDLDSVFFFFMYVSFKNDTSYYLSSLADFSLHK